MAPIIYASIIAALLFVRPLHFVGFNWLWAWIAAVLLASGLGASAAHNLGYL